jgi:hypothetical protein
MAATMQAMPGAVLDDQKPPRIRLLPVLGPGSWRDPGPRRCALPTFEPALLLASRLLKELIYAGGAAKYRVVRDTAA